MEKMIFIAFSFIVLTMVVSTQNRYALELDIRPDEFTPFPASSFPDRRALLLRALEFGRTWASSESMN
jgi:hypothetical protein